MTVKTAIENDLNQVFEAKEIEEVKFFPTRQAKIAELEEAYFQVLRRCDKNRLYNKKGFYIVVVSRQNNLSFQIMVHSRNKLTQKKKLERTLEIIKQYQPEGKVFLGQNNPLKPISPNKEETLLARHLKKFSEEIQVKLIDQFIMSSTECYSFNENDYMKDAHV
ncbi:MAG: hypothetical protein JWR54_1039 [Mucilaginibacter sp.]|nr:hypothetical protein [Mucilaginibacter sp.]